MPRLSSGNSSSNSSLLNSKEALQFHNTTHFIFKTSSSLGKLKFQHQANVSEKKSYEKWKSRSHEDKMLVHTALHSQLSVGWLLWTPPHQYSDLENNRSQWFSHATSILTMKHTYIQQGGTTTFAVYRVPYIKQWGNRNYTGWFGIKKLLRFV